MNAYANSEALKLPKIIEPYKINTSLNFIFNVPVEARKIIPAIDTITIINNVDRNTPKIYEI